MLRQSLAALFVFCVACGDSEANDTASASTPGAPVASASLNETGEPAPAAAVPGTKTAGSAAAVTGMIKFDGEVPARPAVDLSPDPFCVDGNPGGIKDHGILTGREGGLADAFVQLTGVPDEKYKAPEKPIQIDQRGCRYFPHLQGMIKKQDIEILNSDATLHNIHALPKTNREFNVGMPEKDMKITKTFKKAEDAVTIKCDVHPWMKAYVFVMEHPYFATTDANGGFKLPTEGLPDGDYGVKVWHEVLGSAEGRVKVSAGAATFEHTFKGGAEG